MQGGAHDVSQLKEAQITHAGRSLHRRRKAKSVLQADGKENSQSGLPKFGGLAPRRQEGLLCNGLRLLDIAVQTAAMLTITS